MIPDAPRFNGTHVPALRLTGTATHGRAVPYCPCGWVGVSVDRLNIVSENMALQAARQHVAEANQ